MGFEPCRYDGTMATYDLVSKLAPYVEFLTVCPEVDMGLGVPRPPMILVEADETTQVLIQSTRTDLTRRAREFCATYLRQLPPVDGFLLKAHSPSCGVNSTPIHNERLEPIKMGSGFFAQSVLSAFPTLPVADEEMLAQPDARRHFLTRIFALADLRETFERLQSIAQLEQFHAKYKYLLMAHSPQNQKHLGALIATWKDRGLDATRQAYATTFSATLAHVPSLGMHVNAIQHILGYFKDLLSPEEKKHIHRKLEELLNGLTTLQNILQELRATVARLPNSYIEGQAYLWPFPDELA